MTKVYIFCNFSWRKLKKSIFCINGWIRYACINYFYTLILSINYSMLAWLVIFYISNLIIFTLCRIYIFNKVFKLMCFYSWFCTCLNCNLKHTLPEKMFENITCAKNNNYSIFIIRISEVLPSNWSNKTLVWPMYIYIYMYWLFSRSPWSQASRTEMRVFWA